MPRPLAAQWRRSSRHPPPQRRASLVPASTLPTGRHPCRSGRTARGPAAPDAAWLPATASAGVLALCPPGPSLQAVVLPPFLGTSAPPASLPTPRRFGLALSTRPCSNASRRVGPLQFHTGPWTRAAPRTPEESSAAPIASRCLLPSPWHARLGPLCLSADHLSRRQDSRDVAARRLAPSVEARDAPLGAADLSPTLGPATERIGAYSGGTCTRRFGAASLDAPCRDGGATQCATSSTVDAWALRREVRHWEQVVAIGPREADAPARRSLLLRVDLGQYSSLHRCSTTIVYGVRSRRDGGSTAGGAGAP